jgi:hypothetical protein
MEHVPGRVWASSGKDANDDHIPDYPDLLPAFVDKLVYQVGTDRV